MKILKISAISRVWVIISLLFANTAKSQLVTHITDNYNRFQYGASIKATLEFELGKYNKTCNYKFSADAGISSDFIGEWAHPSLNVEMQLYNGGLGSRRRDAMKQSFSTFDVITALTMTIGAKNRLKETDKSILDRRLVPLSYFSDFATPALQNPYGSSFSFGSNFVFSNDDKKSFQRVGFIGFNFFRTIQFSYYNDGGPIMAISGLGDGKDRYHTGGGSFSYIGRQKDLINYITISYHKFTGYTLNAFEASNKMNLAYMDYKDREQFYFNKSMYNIRISSYRNGLELNLHQYNSIKRDAQHAIHWISSAAYHMVPYNPYFAISGSYFRAYNKLGLL